MNERTFTLWLHYARKRVLLQFSAMRQNLSFITPHVLRKVFACCQKAFNEVFSLPEGEICDMAAPN